MDCLLPVGGQRLSPAMKIQATSFILPWRPPTMIALNDRTDNSQSLRGLVQAASIGACLGRLLGVIDGKVASVPPFSEHGGEDLRARVLSGARIIHSRRNRGPGQDYLGKIGLTVVNRWSAAIVHHGHRIESKRGRQNLFFLRYFDASEA